MTAASYAYYPSVGYARSSTKTKEWTDTTIESSRPAMQVESSEGKIRIKVAGRVPRWLVSTFDEMNDLLNLRAGWDSYGAHAVSADAVAATIRFLGLVMQEESRMPFIVPMSSGNIQLEWHSGGVDIEVEVTPDGPGAISIEQTGAAPIASSIHGNLSLMKQVISNIPRR